MESWCSETVSPNDSITRTKNDVLMGWESKNPFSYENSILFQNQQSVDNSAYPEVGFAEMMRKQFSHDSVSDVFTSNASVGGIISPSMITFSAISGDDDSSSKLSSLVVDSNSRESSLIDLKLGGFGYNLSSKSSKANPISSSSVSSTPAKRARVTGLSSQTAYCQVYGCNKDLSPLKDYYKRHKVCEAHSKTSKVIVNGIEQRFCQQCSRFHLVAEFDDGKRSCRKRLAGHNERRRKPQVGLIGSTTGRSLHSYAGSEDNGFQESTLTLSSTSTSFICQEMDSFFSTEKYSPNDWGGKHIKVEDHGTNYVQKAGNTLMNKKLEQKSVLPSCLFGKQYPFLIDNRNNAGPGIVSSAFFQAQANSLENQELTLFDEASTVQLLPGISDSGCALSLLSSQSPSSSHPYYIVSEVSGALNRRPSYRDSVNFNFGNGILQASEFMNVKDNLSHEDEGTIDLLQLSSQLERVETQKQYEAAKQQTEGFCCLRMT